MISLYIIQVLIYLLAPYCSESSSALSVFASKKGPPGIEGMDGKDGKPGLRVSHKHMRMGGMPTHMQNTQTHKAVQLS